MTSNGSGCAHCFRRRNQEPDVPPRIIARCSTASFGSFERVHLGGTYPPSMVPGERLPAASIAGNELGYGSAYCKPCNSKRMRMDDSIGASIT